MNKRMTEKSERELLLQAGIIFAASNNQNILAATRRVLSELFQIAASELELEAEARDLSARALRERNRALTEGQPRSAQPSPQQPSAQRTLEVERVRSRIPSAQPFRRPGEQA